MTLQVFLVGGRWRSWQNTQVVERSMGQGGLTLAAGCVRSKKTKVDKKKLQKNPSHPEHTTKATASQGPRPTQNDARRNTSHALAHTRSPGTATNSRRLATKHIPRVSSYSPDFIDPRFVEIGVVQLSRSVKTTNVTHTHTHRQTT